MIVMSLCPHSLVTKLTQCDSIIVDDLESSRIFHGQYKISVKIIVDYRIPMKSPQKTATYCQ